MKSGDRWLSIADRHPHLLTHRCGPLQRGADRLKIQNPPTRRMYLRVSADPSETTASRHFNLSLHVLLSVSRREFLHGVACCKACMSGWVSHFRLRGRHFDSFAQVVDSRTSREQADGARVSCAHAQGLFWCEHVDHSPGAPPPPYCKKNAGTFVEKCRHYTLHRCKVYCLHFCASM